MENQITIREAITEQDSAIFWTQMYTYFQRDLFPEPDCEDLEYFLGPEYHEQIQQLRKRPQDRCFFLFFQQNQKEIGFALPVIYNSEDGKCFIMEFCIYPEFRGRGLGQQCAKTLLRWAGSHGAQYAELNYGGQEPRRHFWERVGFMENGVDEWGDPLMILPPSDALPVRMERLTDPDDWQLKKLENSYLREIGEPPLSEEAQARLSQAVRDGFITFLIAKRNCRSVGMCSIATCFSTFSCTPTGVLEDFYVEPAFRKQGIAGMLARAAQDWCKERGIPSLTVCCAPCDEEMYQALGFHARLGTTFAYLP